MYKIFSPNTVKGWDLKGKYVLEGKRYFYDYDQIPNLSKSKLPLREELIYQLIDNKSQFLVDTLTDYQKRNAHKHIQTYIQNGLKSKKALEHAMLHAALEWIIEAKEK